MDIFILFNGDDNLMSVWNQSLYIIYDGWKQNAN